MNKALYSTLLLVLLFGINMASARMTEVGEEVEADVTEADSVQRRQCVEGTCDIEKTSVLLTEDRAKDKELVANFMNDAKPVPDLPNTTPSKGVREKRK